MDFLTSLVDANTLGGWVRAGVASLFGYFLPKMPIVASIFGPDLQTAAGVVVAGVIVGVWSHVAKSNAAAKTS